MLAAARRTGADAIHPGYGFLSESASFAEEVEAAGLTWIGPAPDAVRAMGDKVRARALAIRSDVPVLAGTGPGRRSRRAAPPRDRIGYPVVLKAAAAAATGCGA